MIRIRTLVSALSATAAVFATSLIVVPAADATQTAARTTHAGSCHRTIGSYPTVRPGDRGPAVRTLQCTLDDLGFHVVVDGWYGPQTRRVIHRIENHFEGPRQHPGMIDAGMWTLLIARNLDGHTLRLGDRGRQVRILQRSLRAAGASIVVDGWFGPQTRRVVRAYQRANLQRVTGVANLDVLFCLTQGSTF